MNIEEDRTLTPEQADELWCQLKAKIGTARNRSGERGMILGFTGSRHGCTPRQLAALKSVLAGYMTEATGATHGCCAGADVQFHGLVRDMIPRARIVGHPGPKCKWSANCDCDEMLPRADFAIRNREIVRSCDVLVACPSTEWEVTGGSGSWLTVRIAREEQKPIILCLPSGQVKREGFDAEG